MLNSFYTIVALYILYMEADIGEPKTEEFAYVYCIKSLAKNQKLWYTSKHGPNINDNMETTKTSIFTSFLIALESLGLAVSAR